MKIRRYLGKDTQEAILKVKMDLGNEAVILNTRKVRQKGFFKLFSKPLVEVLAAIDEYTSKKNNLINSQPDVAPSVMANEVVAELPVFQEIPGLKENGIKMVELETKVANMETILNKVYEQLQTTEKRFVESNNTKRSPVSTDILNIFYGNLIKNDVDADIADVIIDTVKQRLGDKSGFNDIANVVYNLITGILGKPEPLTLKEDGSPTVVIFLGPTGVGKTTTIAKIAADYSINYKKSVGLITADTYRIAAFEQLKTYAEILGMPVEVIYSYNEIQDAIGKFSDKDIVLIDTAGISSKNAEQFEELKGLVEASNADEVFLVMSTTTSMRNCKEILNSYEFLEKYKLIFTKLDETPITGIILNAKYLTGKGLSYVTIGQSVPDDIEVVNVEKISKNLLGSIA